MGNMGVADILIAGGIPAGAVRWMIYLLFSPALCWGQDQLESPILREALAVILGVVGCYYCFGVSIANLLVSSGGVYAIMLLARRQCGLLSFSFSFSFLIYWWVARSDVSRLILSFNCTCRIVNCPWRCAVTSRRRLEARGRRGISTSQVRGPVHAAAQWA